MSVMGDGGRKKCLTVETPSETLSDLFLQNKMPQRRDNAGAVCDSGMGMLFLIVNFCRTEGYCTKKWGRISPGFYWYHQK